MEREEQFKLEQTAAGCCKRPVPYSQLNQHRKGKRREDISNLAPSRVSNKSSRIHLFVGEGGENTW